jgi:hypothetical protein
MIDMTHKVTMLLVAGVIGYQVAYETAWAGGGDTPNGVVAGPTESTILQSTPNVSTGAAALSASPISLQQTGVNNFANVGTATMPNCGGVCLYTNVRSISGNGGGFGSGQTEISGGVMWQLSSPEQSNIESQRRLVDANIDKSRDEQKDIWMTKLIEALNRKDMSGARGWAILLSPKLGKTADQLLQEMSM